MDFPYAGFPPAVYLKGFDRVRIFRLRLRIFPCADFPPTVFSTVVGFSDSGISSTFRKNGLSSGDSKIYHFVVPKLPFSFLPCIICK